MPLVVYTIISATKPSRPPNLPSFKLFILFFNSDMINCSLRISLNAPSSPYSSTLLVKSFKFGIYNRLLKIYCGGLMVLKYPLF